MKEKFAMEEKFFDFAQTKEALSQLSADLAVLDSQAQSKIASIAIERDNYNKSITERDAKIEDMGKSVRDAVAKIDSITGYIDGVL